MSWPTPAQRGDWFSSNHERPPLEGHEAGYTMLAAGQYVPACRTDSCIDDDPGLLMHATWFDALDDARTILTDRIHGSSA